MRYKKQVWPSLSSTIIQVWKYLISEPLNWILLCFFQPARFHKEHEFSGLFSGFIRVFRLVIPLFFLSFIFYVPTNYIFSLFFYGYYPYTDYYFHILLDILFSSPLSIAIGFGPGLILGMLFGELGIAIILALSLGITAITIGNETIGFINGLGAACALGLVGGTARGFKWGIMPWGIVASLVGGFFWAISSFLIKDVTSSIIGGMQVAGAFFISYTIGYSRLLLYVVSGPSGLWTYRKSKRHPEQVFVHIHNSSLYWDECVFLPIPYLQQTLHIARDSNVAQTIKELTFIILKRPSQQRVALNVLSEIALHDMQLCETNADIAKAHQRISSLWTLEIKLVASHWITSFGHLSDAAMEIERYCNNLNWHIRHDALEKALLYLDNIYLDSAFPDIQLTEHLDLVVTQWRRIIRQTKEKLERGGDETSQILNPYIAGDALKDGDNLFVGRRDIVRQLSESLSNKNNRPTFLLNGERRMGKSSTLRQLPHLLGASYVPIFYDLQYLKPSSIDLFLSRLTREICKTLRLRGIHIEELEQSTLKEALQKNEAAVYSPFDEWLDRLEYTLEREGRTILLLFDEFEKLEEASEKYLDLNLLLDWFRGTIQNRSSIALLFSGVQTPAELGAHWASRFVNVKSLRLSFLHPAEAHDLIMRPISQNIFGQGVIEEIMRMTNCHPFLVQALCSAIINELNIEKYKSVEIPDVAKSVLQVLEAWDGYFLDLWDRTDVHQRSCLTLLLDEEGKDFSTLLSKSELDKHILRQAIQTLLRRDLILLDNGYRIATPIFRIWLEHNI